MILNVSDARERSKNVVLHCTWNIFFKMRICVRAQCSVALHIDDIKRFLCTRSVLCCIARRTI
jgi:hypothetical protein